MDAESKTLTLYSVTGFIAGIFSVIIKINWVAAFFAFGILAASVFITIRILKVTTITLGGTIGWIGNAILPFISIWLLTWVFLYNIFL